MPQHPGAADEVPTLRAVQEELWLAPGEDSGQAPARADVTRGGQQDLCKNGDNESKRPYVIPGATLCKSDPVTREMKAKPRSKEC